MKKIKLLSLLVIVMSSCQEEFHNDCSLVFEEYQNEIMNGKQFNVLYDDYFYNPKNDIDTTFPSTYSLNKLNAEIIKLYNEEQKGLKYYWNDEILETTYSNYYDTVNCECSLLIISHDENVVIPFCFFENKILSTVAKFDFDSEKYLWQK